MPRYRTAVMNPTRRKASPLCSRRARQAGVKLGNQKLLGAGGICGVEIPVYPSSHWNMLVSGSSRPRWRREWDSNPRYGCPYTRFPSVRLQPLGHPSSAPLSWRRRRHLARDGGSPGYPGRSAARSGARQTRDRSKTRCWRSRICGAPLSRCTASGTRDLSGHKTGFLSPIMR